MNNFTNKLYILTEHDDTYTQLIVNRDLPDLEITTNPELAEIVLASPPLIAERLDEFKHLDWVKYLCRDQQINPTEFASDHT
ncbi:hypothetical protein O9992_08120 [Vibrio lentus]|nr:hypothetical protein [Vibrio lentus]